ncbi:MAG TPA: protein-L-isoaspartate O-methyltransferase [Rhodospirillaceae bacterium]|nr:protein-L-isoaspartate O-methyltransferase [Rhodospirillaceae bacterium]
MAKLPDLEAEKAILLKHVADQAAETASYLGADVLDSRVIAALGAVRREAFLPEQLKIRAYDNRPQPIGHGQTISQPYIVAAMSHLLQIPEEAKVLEIGTGCGYQSAVLAEFAAEVVSVERISKLAFAARDRLASQGYVNVSIHEGDGWQGWPEEAPYDGIIVTAAAPRLPQPLVAQLKPGGRLVIPNGGRLAGQKLMVFEKALDGSLVESCGLPVAFVPLVEG